VELKGRAVDRGDVDLNFLFPGKTKIFADWFNGEIRLPQGPMLEYVHMGYASMFLTDFKI
jgi:hypothetical protein